MSRSYKKTPRSGDKKNKYFKKYANRVYRRDKFNILQHGAIRRIIVLMISVILKQ